MKRWLLKFTSLFFSTIIVMALFVYQFNQSTIKTKFFKKAQGQLTTETNDSYFHRIGKSWSQMQYNKYSTIGVNILQTLPVVLAFATKNALMYTSYAGAIVIVTPLVVLPKKIVKEPRPDDPRDLTSFPSGHTTFAFLVVGILFYCINHRRKYFISSVCLLCACLVALFRVLAQRHWCVDIIAGAIFGLTASTLSYLCVKYFNQKIKLFL